ncbi:lipoyltransferase [Metschnikowia bicuspidata var. bicuspidata NRRL YB-4993]|uniref:Octanoyltransferase n=1 Tax=Metschnikowia bicuspidata var. bicuspidata NRRL YB-4993 TaxID=869754 RepID=A0A1A0HCI5_9ASCO|nr:lipoyltransferase [Metschnikowia bicuspidata var. bicuspidata NRRL YB-4993]OBA21628.1 lipoyltransferase [Metschnikowia bicuspidata var. bicuspidata NRRL YB-4993]
MRMFLVRRFSSACASKFQPLNEDYRTLRHIHFDGVTPFVKGQAIQNKMVSANLDFKKMEATIKKKQKAFALQGLQLQEFEQEFIQRVLSMKPFPTLLTFEFDGVYTGGKQMKQDPTLPEQIAAFNRLGCEYHQLERGGQVTWHGKGQLTAYLIMDLKQFSDLTVRCYVDSVLLKAVQNLLEKRFGLPSFVNDNPGVWMSPDNLKICSVGCNIQRAITSYGIGLNVRPDLKFLNTHIMCGMPGTRATSIQELKPEYSGSIKEVGENFAQELAKRLNLSTIEHMNGADLLAEESLNAN